jgi:CubicO group peptidase (beta-lactamase class C family)
MKNTYYDLTQAQKKLNGLPTIPTMEGRALFMRWEFSGRQAVCIPRWPDMLKYLQQQISETNPAVKLTHQQTVGNVGLGWGVRKKAMDQLDFQHNGSTIGFISHISVFPQGGSGLVILANSKADIGPIISGVQRVLTDR